MLVYACIMCVCTCLCMCVIVSILEASASRTELSTHIAAPAYIHMTLPYMQYVCVQGQIDLHTVSSLCLAQMFLFEKAITV